MDCPFCNNSEIASRTITENDLAFVFLTNIPIVPGHLLIAPKRHVKYYEELTKDEKEAVESLREQMKVTLKKAFRAEGFNYAWNEEKAGGQSIFHFHLHMLPRKEGDSGIYNYEPRDFLYRPGSRAESPEAELAEVAEVIRKDLVE